jgi:hypothetical protein
MARKRMEKTIAAQRVERSRVKKMGTRMRALVVSAKI